MKLYLPLILISLMGFAGCGTDIQSASGVRMAKVGALATDDNGHTVEQANIINKVKIDAEADKEWFVYVVSPYTGKVILESKAIGKITSSGKRLSPKHVTGTDSGAMQFRLPNGTLLYTDELPAEDGSYGESTEYIYWKDDKGRNRRHYMMGGQILHIADKPLGIEDLLATKP